MRHKRRCVPLNSPAHMSRWVELAHKDPLTSKELFVFVFVPSHKQYLRSFALLLPFVVQEKWGKNLYLASLSYGRTVSWNLISKNIWRTRERCFQVSLLLFHIQPSVVLFSIELWSKKVVIVLLFLHLSCEVARHNHHFSSYTFPSKLLFNFYIKERIFLLSVLLLYNNISCPIVWQRKRLHFMLLIVISPPNTTRNLH